MRYLLLVSLFFAAACSASPETQKPDSESPEPEQTTQPIVPAESDVSPQQVALTPEQRAKCEDTLSIVAQNSEAHVVFEPLPDKPTLRYVTMNWADAQVPVAVEPVKDVIITKGESGLNVLAHYEDGAVLIALTGVDPISETSREIYTYTPSDVTCDEPRKVSNLALKSIASPYETTSVHRFGEGVLKVGVRDGKNFTDWHFANGNTVSYYHTSREGFAQAIGKSGGGVVWVDTVNAVLALPTKDVIEQAKVTFKKLGFGRKTLDALDELLAPSEP